MFFCELNLIQSLVQQIQPYPSDLNKDYSKPNYDFIWPEANSMLWKLGLKFKAKKIPTFLPALQIWLAYHYMTGFTDSRVPDRTKLVQTKVSII